MGGVQRDAFGALAAAASAPARDVEARAPGRQLVDLVLPARYVGWALADELGRLAPYGPGHLEPVLAVTGLRVGDVRRVGAARDSTSRSACGAASRRSTRSAFGVDAERALPEAGDAVDLVGTLERDTFGGQPRLRLRVIDYADADASPLLGRGEPSPVELARAG